MSKQATFFAGWRDYKMMPDKSMSRDRMARLMRAWRRSRTKGTRNFDLKRIGAHHYMVAARGYEDEYHYVSWQ